VTDVATNHDRSLPPSKAFIEKTREIDRGRKEFGCGQADGTAGKDEARAVL
jgi:hypothetical protein